MKRDDALWKAILEDVFDDFLLFFFPNANELFLLENDDETRRIEYLDKELEQLFPPEQDTYAPRYVDKLVKVFIREKGQPHEQWILIHIEIQGYKDPRFAERMFQYYYRIFDKYRQPITAFAIFTDGRKGYHPNKYEQSYLGTQLSYQYNTYKIHEQSETDLLVSTNPFALVVLTVKAALKAKNLTDEELLELKLRIAKVLLSSQISKGKIRSLMNFLRYYVRLENPETNRKFEREIEAITQKSTTMGIEQFLLERAKKEGIEQGADQEKRVLVARLLTKTSFTSEQIADIVEVSVAFVDQVRKDPLPESGSNGVA
jgi:predicted transposase/invertase (TIGR01784 family)